jgi:hypothetical protein
MYVKHHNHGLNVWDSVSGVAEIFHVVTKVFIMLLLDGL